MWLRSYEEISFQSGLNSSKVAPIAWKILQEVVKKCRSHAHADKSIKSCLFRQGQNIHYDYVEMWTRLCEALCTEEPELRPNNYKFENYST